jgi:acetyl-CoA carboxylase biotin carboxyl carrier protein
MIDLAFVESLIKALDESSLDTVELERGGTKIRLSKSAAAPLVSAPTPGMYPGMGQLPSGMVGTDPVSGIPAQTEAEVVAAVPDGLLEVVSPMVGTYYSSPAPDAEPYIEVGQRIREGTVLCIIEAMKLMNEMESEVEGTVAKILVENAQPVEYGQVLFLIDPS